MGTGIAVTPERLREISAQISAGASEVDAILSRVANEVAPTHTEWVGPAQAQFGALWVQLQTDASGLRAILTGIAKLTQNAAEAYEAAEQAIAKSFTEFRATNTPELVSEVQPNQVAVVLDETPSPVEETVGGQTRESAPTADPRFAQLDRPAWSFDKDVALKNGRKAK